MGQLLTTANDPASLEYRDLDIVSIPRQLLHRPRPNLKTLVLSGNKLTDFPHLESVAPHLRLLVLSKNLFRIVPPVLGKFLELEKLVCSHYYIIHTLFT